MQHWTEKSSDELFAALLKRASASELKSFLEDISKKDVSLQHQFIIRFAESSGIAAEEKYHLLIRSIFQLSAFNAESSRASLLHYFERAQQFIDSRDYLDAFFMSAAFIKEYRSPLFRPGENGTDRLIRTFAMLSAIMESDAGFDLKEKVFHFLLNEVRNSAANFTGAEKESWLGALIDSTSDEAQLQQVLDFIAGLVGDNRSQFGETMDEKTEEQLLLAKLRLLKRLNRTDDVRHLLESNRRLKPFRLMLIDDCIREQQWEEAKELIKEGRRTELRKGSINLSSEWDELLLKIAEEENDVKSIRNLALQLFLSSEYDFKYYFLLKHHYDTSRWKSQLDRIVTSIKKEKAFATKGIHAVAKIFIEDEEWENLLWLLEKNAHLDFAERYADYLKEKFPEQLLEIYRKAIRRFAEKYMGPEAYRMVADALKKMLALPKSKEIVQSLMIELKVNYRQRRAMVDELNKVVL